MRKNIKETPDKEISWKWVVVSCLCVLGVVIGCVWLIVDVLKKNEAQKVYEDLSKEMQQVVVENVEESVDETTVNDTSAEETDEPQEEIEETEVLEQEEEVEVEVEVEEIVDPYEKKVDFSMLQGSVDSNIYAWIYIPGTMIDYPVLQHPTDNSYYLNHNLNGKEGYPGCIYTEYYNSKDFTNFNTVIYGHNMQNGTMFAGLAKFLNSQYLEEHPNVYIYSPDKMSVYEIFAIYEYSDEHLLAGKDMTNAHVINSYLDNAKAVGGANGIWDKNISVTSENKIITLSTCISGKDNKRLLLQAVLKEE